MSETDSITEEPEEFIAIGTDYVVLAEGEELRDIEQGTNVIVLSDGQEIVSAEDDCNVVIADDEIVMVEEEDDPQEALEVEGAQIVYQREEEVVDEPVPKTPAQLRAELEEKRKRHNLPRCPKRFLLFDGIVAEIVDYDDEDGSPIVEFAMVADDKESERLPVECGICPDIMHKSKLDEHLKTHIKPGTKRFMCIYCEENFVTRAYAAGHARRHMGIRPYVCVPCKLYYCTKQDLRVHEQRRHLAKEHICEHCGKTFAQNTSLKHHRMLVHEQQRRYECEHCGKRFLRRYAKNEHVRNVHFGDRRLLDCPFCEMHFKDTHKLAQHRKEMHLHQSTFECRVCGQVFTHIDFFDAHRRSLQCRNKLKRDDLEQQLQVVGREPEEEQQEVIVEEMAQDVQTEVVDDNDHIEVDEREKVKAEQQLLYEIAAMDNV